MAVETLALAALAWLLTYALHSTAFLGLIALGHAVRAPRSPALRERIWRIGLVAGLVTASLQLGLGLEPALGRWHPGFLSSSPAPADSGAAGAAKANGIAGIARETKRVESAGMESAELAGRAAEPRGVELGAATSESLLPEEPMVPPALAWRAILDAALAAHVRDARVRDGSAPESALEEAHHASAHDASARSAPDLSCAPPFLARSAARLTPPAGPPPAGADAEPRTGAPEASSPPAGALVTDADGAAPRRAEDASMSIPAPGATAAPLEAAPPARKLEGAEAGLVTRGRDALRALSARTEGTWPSLVAIAWGALAGGAVLWIALHLAALSARLRDRRELDEGPLRALLDDLSLRAGARCRVRLSVSSALSSPVTLGIFRREICVPVRALTDLHPHQQESMLAHELAHALRRDPAWFGFVHLIERVFFFQPLNRVARRALEAEAELLCDGWAVRWTGRRLELASCLAEIARWMLERRTPRLLVAGMAANRSHLTRRIERLIDGRELADSNRVPAWRAALAAWGEASLALACLGAVVVAAPGVSAPFTGGAGGGQSAARAPAPAPARTPQPFPLPRLALRPAAAPALSGPLAPSASAAPREPVLELLSAQRRLALELVALDAELAELRALCAELDAPPTLGAALAALEEKLARLRERGRHLALLLAPAPGATPTDPLSSTVTTDPIPTPP